MITLRFLMWLVMLILAIITAHFKLRLFPHVLIIFLLAIPIVSFIFLHFFKKKLKISINPKTRMIDKEEMGEWVLTIYNNSKTQPAMTQIKQENERMMNLYTNPYESLNLSLTKKSEHIGVLSPPLFSLKVLDSFRLMKSNYKHIVTDSIIVLPRLESPLLNLKITDQLLVRAQSALMTSLLRLEDLEMVRPMEPGDSMKRMHWKLSARLGDWFVRTEESGPQPKIELIVYPNKGSSDLDHRDDFLEVVVSQIAYFLNKKLSLVFMGTDYTDITQINQARLSFALIEIDHSIELRPESDQSVVLVFIESLSEQIISQLILLRNEPIIYLFNKNEDPALLELATYNNLLIIQDEEI